MTELNISFTKENYQFPDQSSGLNQLQYNYYGEDFNAMKQALTDLLENLHEPFLLCVTFEMEDALSFKLLCECLLYIYCEKDFYHNVLTIKALLSKDQPIINEHCKLSASSLYFSNQHLLIDIQLFYTNKTSSIVEPSHLVGEMLAEKLLYLCQDDKDFLDLNLPNFKQNEIIQTRNKLRELFLHPEIFNAFMAGAFCDVLIF